jgi:hypothetical protein
MNMMEFLLAAIAFVIALGAIGVWGIYAILKRGFNEHIRGLQAIYESTKKD